MSRQQRKYIVAIAIGNIGMLLIYLLGELQQTKFSGEELQSIASLYFGLEAIFYFLGGGLLFGGIIGFLFVMNHQPDLSDVFCLAGKTFLIVCACRFCYSFPHEQMYYLPMIEPALIESGGILIGALIYHCTHRAKKKQGGL